MPKPNIGLEDCQHFVGKWVYCFGHIVRFEDLWVKSPRSPWKGNPDFSTFSRAFSGALFVPTVTANGRYTTYVYIYNIYIYIYQIILYALIQLSHTHAKSCISGS